MNTIVSAAFLDFAELATVLRADRDLQSAVDEAANRALAVILGGGKLLFAGNGGSAAEAQHLAAEYVSKFNLDRPGLAAIALTTDTSIMTSIGNDYGFEKLFERQIEALGRKGDLLFLSSTSGRSANILSGLAAARRQGVATVLLTGSGYHSAAVEPDILLKVPSKVTARIQEAHLLIGHTICEFVEQRMFGS